MPKKKAPPAKNVAGTIRQNTRAGQNKPSASTGTSTRQISVEREISEENILESDSDEENPSVINNTNRGNVSKNRQRKQQIPTRKTPQETQQINTKKMPPVNREIMKLQEATRALIPKLPFSRLIRECLQNCSHSSDLRVTSDSLLALQEASELYLTQLFEDSYRCTLHRQRVTLQPNDMRLVLLLRGTSISD